MKIAIQGIKGSFHEEAALNYFGEKTEVMPSSTFEDVCIKVHEGIVNAGIMAIENTISGTIHSNLNLIRRSGLKITGEVFLRIQQNLVAFPGAKLLDIKKVFSHFMALNQCRNYFADYPEIQLIESEDTAMSIRELSLSGEKDKAAIGSINAAHSYNMEIIAEGIETCKENYTRFLILEKEHRICSQNNKASLVLTLAHQKGSLAMVLNFFHYFSMNLTKIESQPILGEPWHYLFFVDVQFDELDAYFQMLDSLKSLAQHFERLGEYIAATTN